MYNFFKWLEESLNQFIILDLCQGSQEIGSFFSHLEGMLFIWKKGLGSNLFSDSSSGQDEKQLIRILDRYLDTYPQSMDGLNIMVWAEDAKGAER